MSLDEQYLVEPRCPACRGIVEPVGPGGLADVFYLCSRCARHWERMDVDTVEINLGTGEVQTWRSTFFEDQEPAGPIGFRLPEDVEWIGCTECGELVAWLRQANGFATVVNVDGTLHSNSCVAFIRLPRSGIRTSAEQVDLEIAGQFSMDLGR